MHAYNLAPALLLLGGAAAAPAPAPTLVARADVLAPTAAWISVAKDGVPTTVTPVPTTISGTPTLASAAPNALTGSVFVITDYHLVKVTTSTGSPPVPTAKHKNGEGAFAPCNNTDGDFAPFCDPAKDSVLYTDTTYYVTWDSSALIKGNQTDVRVKIKGKEVNGTTVGEVVFNKDTDSSQLAAYGYYAWTANSNLIPRGQSNTTIELLMQYTINGVAQKDITGPQVLVAKRPSFHPEGAKVPKGAELYIALPTVFGFLIICLIGGCLWNRSTRKIGLGNIMSRSRHGYGVGKSRAQRLGQRVRKSVFRGGKDRGIALRTREISPDGYQYHDNPVDQHHDVGRPRRDSDALGSLAGSPTEDRFHDRFQDTGVQGGNAFRDEMRRQERERY
ncbi:uncharacterized protein CTRU02_209626 [Colletotrichum truncatum]|uniref:Uncharacterized protein n=1 Tax=Colletotrichum truncatum TaxID=5467 RepID=A0ACC3YSX8_COLTU|nr:uncharacterized protein CTRU02_12073 [Colletotrichum truncatum]KAF6785141.1 hypothetical protein CTRU02_12073 [Colletotrichum truncatum]